MLTATHPTAAATLASLIPAAELAAAVRLAFETLLAILRDDKSPPRERRMAATTILKLASTSPERERAVTPTPRAPSTSPSPTAPPTLESPEIPRLIPRLPLDVAPQARDLPGRRGPPREHRVDRRTQVGAGRGQSRAGVGGP